MHLIASLGFLFRHGQSAIATYTRHGDNMGAPQVRRDRSTVIRIITVSLDVLRCAMALLRVVL